MVERKEDKLTPLGFSILLLVGITPFMRALFGGRGLLLYGLMIALVCLVFTMLNNGFRIRKISSIQMWMIVISVLMMISPLLSSFSGSFSLESAKVQIATIILFAYLLNRKETKILVLISYLAAAYFIFCYFFQSDFYLRGARKYIELQPGIWLDPNMVTASFIVPSLFSIYYLVNGRKAWARIFHAVFLILSLYCAFLGGSRGGLLAIVIASVALYFMDFKPTGRRLFFSLGVIVVLIIGMYVVYRNIPEALLQRMTLDSITETGGSGRFGIYTEHFQSFFQRSNVFRLLFGHGREAAVNILGFANHNIILDYLWDLGIIGVVIYIITTIKAIRYCKCNNSPLTIAMMIGIILWSMTVSASNQLIYFVVIYSIVCLSKFYNNEDLGIEER